jgi:hypothetical protein
MFPGKTEAAASLSEGMWKETTLAEPAMLHVALSAAYREESLRKRIGGTPKAVWHETCAIRLLSDKLGSEGGCVDDGILGAVFTLACIEVSLLRIYEYDSQLTANPMQGMVGSEAISEKHVNGLAQVISIRRTKGINRTPVWFKDALT